MNFELTYSTNEPHWIDYKVKINPTTYEFTLFKKSCIHASDKEIVSKLISLLSKDFFDLEDMYETEARCCGHEEIHVKLNNKSKTVHASYCDFSEIPELLQNILNIIHDLIKNARKSDEFLDTFMDMNKYIELEKKFREVEEARKLSKMKDDILLRPNLPKDDKDFFERCEKIRPIQDRLDILWEEFLKNTFGKKKQSN